MLAIFQLRKKLNEPKLFSSNIFKLPISHTGLNKYSGKLPECLKPFGTAI